MIIQFNNKQLEKFANNNQTAIKKWGAKRAQLFITRLNQLQSISSMEEVNLLPGKHHPLKNERKGQWACNLDGGWRLIYRPTKKNNGVAYEIVRVEQVTDYH